MAPAEIKAQFVAANSQMHTENIVIGCANNTLVQVQFLRRKGRHSDRLRWDQGLPRDQYKSIARDTLSRDAKNAGFPRRASAGEPPYTKLRIST